MIKLRLARFGKKGAPTYRIIAIHARTKRQGRALDYIGHYNPRTQPSTIEVDKDKATEWLNKGAQPTDTVKSLLIKAGVMKSDYKPAKEKPVATKKTKTTKPKTKK